MNSRICQIARLLAALCCLLSTQWASASSVSVVTHGFDAWADLFPGLPGGPLRDLGLALYNYWSVQPGGAVEYQYDPSYQGLTWLRGAAANENKIIVFDWSSDSNDHQAGYDEGAGDVMFAMLRQYNLLNSGGASDSALRVPRRPVDAARRRRRSLSL
jgi:hypothetical protein